MTQQAGLQEAAPSGVPARPNRKPGYRPEIQGLRSLAVLMVMTYHIWFGRVSGGVDVFLLVSAFLMTLQFVGRYEDGRPTALVKHWLHLFRRLVPAAVVVVVATLAATILFLPRTRWLDIVGQAWASLVYSENWLLQAQATDYYASDHSTASPFQHFWSLSIQGQVFILWPLIFVGAGFLAKRFRLKFRALLAYVFGLVFAVSLVYSIVFTAASQTEAYFDTGARLWEFALGSLVALALPLLRIPAPWRVRLGWLGIAAMLSCGFLLDVQASFPGSIALWPTLAAACVIIAGQTGNRFGADRILSSRPLVRLGDMSYAMYLWHWPLLVIALATQERDHAGPLTGSLIIVAAVALAFVTTRFVERPWRQWQWPELSRRRAAVAIVAAVAVAAAPLLGLQLALYFENQGVLAKAARNNPGLARCNRILSIRQTRTQHYCPHRRTSARIGPACRTLAAVHWNRRTPHFGKPAQKMPRGATTPRESWCWEIPMASSGCQLWNRSAKRKAGGSTRCSWVGVNRTPARSTSRLTAIPSTPPSPQRSTGTRRTLLCWSGRKRHRRPLKKNSSPDWNPASMRGLARGSRSSSCGTIPGSASTWPIVS